MTKLVQARCPHYSNYGDISGNIFQDCKLFAACKIQLERISSQLYRSHLTHEFLSPVLMWAYGELLTMCVVVREELFGEYAAPDRLRFALGYGSYVIIPILMMLRVARTPVFGTRKLHRE